MDARVSTAGLCRLFSSSCSFHVRFNNPNLARHVQTPFGVSDLREVLFLQHFSSMEKKWPGPKRCGREQSRSWQCFHPRSTLPSPALAFSCRCKWAEEARGLRDCWWRDPFDSCKFISLLPTHHPQCKTVSSNSTRISSRLGIMTMEQSNRGCKLSAEREQDGYLRRRCLLGRRAKERCKRLRALRRCG